MWAVSQPSPKAKRRDLSFLLDRVISGAQMSSTCTPHCNDMTELDHQPFPKEGKLAQNTNLSLVELKSIIGSDKEFVYCYVVATIEQRDGKFYQTGNAPNFQGDIITLCTCKHYMRTFLNLQSWKGKWIAGFTGVNAGEGKNRLVYLMNTGHTFDSHYSLWHSEIIPPQAKNAKVTNRNRFGDVYQPKDGVDEDLFNYQNYYPPIESHGHYKKNEWHKDINYAGVKGRKSILLAGDIGYSFLWSKPVITLVDRLYIGQKKYELKTLLENLR